MDSISTSYRAAQRSTPFGFRELMVVLGGESFLMDEVTLCPSEWGWEVEKRLKGSGSRL